MCVEMNLIKHRYDKLVAAAKLHDSFVAEKLAKHTPRLWLHKEDVDAICQLIIKTVLSLGKLKTLPPSVEDFNNGITSRKRCENDGRTYELVEHGDRQSHILTDKSYEFQKITLPNDWSYGRPYAAIVHYDNFTVEYYPHVTRIEMAEESMIEASYDYLMFRAIDQGVIHLATVKNNGEIVFSKTIRA
jgi:hypothetical protein